MSKNYNIIKMKKALSLVIFLLCTFLFFQASAQLTKKEEKQWKKRIKKLTPVQYKQLLDENKSLKGQITGLKKNLNGVDERISEKDNQITAYQGQVNDLKSKLTQSQSKIETLSKGGQQSSNNNQSESDPKGIVFKVQIGAYTNKNLSKFSDNATKLWGNSGGDVNRYTIGVFRDYWKADTFKKYLREMGVKDAWIVAFRDGVRVPIKEVLEGISKGR